DGAEIQINCPACEARGVAASTYVQIERVRFFGIPVHRRTSWVVCSQCQKHLLSSADVKDLPGLSEEERNRVIAPYTSFVSRALAVLALLLGWIPLVGFVVAGIAVLLNRRPGLWRRISRIGLAINLVVSAVLGVILLLES